MKSSHFTAIALVLCAASSAAHADTLAKIDASNKMTLAYRESSVPLSYLDGPNKPIGLAVELSVAVADAVKKRLNKPSLEVTWMPVTSQNRIPLVTNGTIDLECGSTTNNTSRHKDVAFAVSHFFTGTRLLVDKNSNIKGWSDLKGRQIAITTGTTNIPIVRKYNAEKGLGLEVITTKDHVDALLLVETGRAAAFAMDDVLLFGLKANAKQPESLEIVGEALQVEPYACMLRKDDPKFKALVDGVITGMMKSGEFEKLYDKWFMGPIPPRGQALGLPMSPQLKENIKSPSDKPAT